MQFAAAQRHQLVLPISANSADAIPAGTTLGPTQHHLLYVLHGISAWQGKQGTTREQQDHLLSVTQHYQQLIQTLEQATPSTTEQHWNPNPLYRLSSCDQALDSQEQTAQLAEQHPNSLLQHPAYYPTPEVSDEPADVVSAWTTFTAGAHMTGAGTIGNQRASAAAELLVQPPSSATGLACYQQCGAHTAHLASALVDANARVSTARAQLVAAQADINMLLGEMLAKVGRPDSVTGLMGLLVLLVPAHCCSPDRCVTGLHLGCVGRMCRLLQPHSRSCFSCWHSRVRPSPIMPHKLQHLYIWDLRKHIGQSQHRVAATILTSTALGAAAGSASAAHSQSAQQAATAAQWMGW